VWRLRSCGDIHRSKAVNDANKVGLRGADILENGFGSGMSRSAPDLAKSLRDLNRCTGELADFTDKAGHGGDGRTAGSPARSGRALMIAVRAKPETDVSADAAAAVSAADVAGSRRTDRIEGMAPTQ
jgi:hypothetical protein